jgi:Cobalamin-independent synthase, N-terminal domain
MRAQVPEVQVLEPALCKDEGENYRGLYEGAFKALAGAKVPINLVTFYDDLGDSYGWVVALPVAAVSIDFCGVVRRLHPHLLQRCLSMSMSCEEAVAACTLPARQPALSAAHIYAQLAIDIATLSKSVQAQRCARCCHVHKAICTFADRRGDTVRLPGAPQGQGFPGRQGARRGRDRRPQRLGRHWQGRCDVGGYW